jgi:pSer/pThr/pTyr-binding forkhead associated (FHA) protein
MSEVRNAPASPGRSDLPVPVGASIRVLQGFYEGLELPVDRAWWVIGRGRGADAVLAEPTISRAHAAIGFQPEAGFFLQDLGSTNGTRLNGARTQRATLSDGDQIQMGKLQLRVGIPGAGS